MEFTSSNDLQRIAKYSVAMQKIEALNNRVYPHHLRMLTEQQEVIRKLSAPAKTAILHTSMNSIVKAERVRDSLLKSRSIMSNMSFMVDQWDKLTSQLNKAGLTSQVLAILNSPFENLKAEEYILGDEDGDVQEQKVELIKTIPNLLSDIYYNHNLLNVVDPRKFEEIVAELLYSKGWEVELTQQTNDGGRDIIALSSISGFPMRMLVECKRWNRKVGIDVIRSFCDVIHLEKPNKGLIVTTSYFTKGANDRKLKEGSLLDLTDRDELLNWVWQYHHCESGQSKESIHLKTNHGSNEILPVN